MMQESIDHMGIIQQYNTNVYNVPPNTNSGNIQQYNTNVYNVPPNTNNRKRKLTNELSNFINTTSTVWGQGDLMVEDISVPTGIVGLLIGKNGAAHQRLQMISGARVYIAPDPPTNIKAVQQQQQQRSVTITGGQSSR